MRHCLERAQEKDRFKPGTTEFDIIMVEILISLGLAKEVQLKNKYGETQYGRKMYHLRYAGVLIAPIIDERDGHIITFMPRGKRVSSQKYYENMTDKKQIYKLKRLKMDKK